MSQVRADILTAIKDGSEVTHTTLLTLLLMTLDEISNKMDAVLADEKGLREAVLNGHSDDHNAHHEWVAKKIAEESDAEKANKQSFRNLRDGLLMRFLPWAITTIVLAVVYGTRA